MKVAVNPCIQVLRVTPVMMEIIGYNAEYVEGMMMDGYWRV